MILNRLSSERYPDYHPKDIRLPLSSPPDEYRAQNQCKSGGHIISARQEISRLKDP